MKIGMKTGAVVLGLVTLAAAMPAAGQGNGGRQGPGARGGVAGVPQAGVVRNVETALQRAETLGLDESQVEALRGLRDESRALRDRWEKEGLEVRQRMRSQDQAVREERRTRMTELRQERREALAPLQERYESILTVEQRQQVRQTQLRDGRAIRDGRPQARRGGEAARRGPAAPGMRRPTGPDGRPAWRGDRMEGRREGLLRDGPGTRALRGDAPIFRRQRITEPPREGWRRSR